MQSFNSTDSESEYSMTNFIFSQSWWRHFRPFEVFWQSDRFPLLARPSMREVVIHRHQYKYITNTVQIPYKNRTNTVKQLHTYFTNILITYSLPFTAAIDIDQTLCFLYIVHISMVLNWTLVFLKCLYSICQVCLYYGKYFAFVLYWKVF